MEEEVSVLKPIDSRTRLYRLENSLYRVGIHVTLSKLLILSMPQYSQLQSGDNSSTSLLGFLQRLNELIRGSISVQKVLKC